jgi:hypothetical protein
MVYSLVPEHHIVGISAHAAYRHRNTQP